MFGQKSKPDAPRREGRGTRPGLAPVVPAQRIPPAPRPGDVYRRGAAARVTASPSRDPGEAEAGETGSPTEPLPFELRRDEKRLIVGKGIVLKGEVTDCDRLVVEGRIEASLTESDVVVIAEGGEFRGNAEVNEADISGAFDGALTVRNRLMVRATGRVSGEIRYGELEIERGGRLAGDVQPKTVDRPADGKAAETETTA